MRGIRWTAAWGIVAAVAALAGCGKPGPVVRDSAKWSGWYQSDTLRGGVQPRVLRLEIGLDSTAEVSVDFAGLGTTRHPGWWAARGDELTMQPTPRAGPPTELPFRWRLEGARLVPLAWDHNVYGEQAVTLTKLVASAGAADSTAGAKR